MTVIRALTADELPWFLARSFGFVGHSDPWGLAQRAAVRLQEPRRDAARSWVRQPAVAEEPNAGVVAWPPNPSLDDPTLRFAQPWFSGSDPEPLVALMVNLLRMTPHEAAELDLSAIPAPQAAQLTHALGAIGFERDTLRTLDFALADTPPLGAPLVFEGWREGMDAGMRAFVSNAEQMALREGRWAWLKRAHGPFTPDLWWLAYETLDQPPVGYVLAGRRRDGIDGVVSLTMLGVSQAHRSSTEMLRRLLLTALQEFAAVAPLGRVQAEFSGAIPKLVSVLRSVGFEVGDPRPVLRRLPA